MLQLHGARVLLNTRASVDVLLDGKFDEIVLATGVTPRKPSIPGIDHPKVRCMNLHVMLVTAAPASCRYAFALVPTDHHQDCTSYFIFRLSPTLTS